MELTELENVWKEYNIKMADNIRLNKEILRKMLAAKPQRRLNRLKAASAFSLLSPIIVLIIISLTNIRFTYPSLNFYIGMGILVPVYILTYIWAIKYFLKVCTIDFSDATLTIKKRVAELEKYEIKITRIRYMLMPLAIAGALLIMIPKFILNADMVIFLLLIILVYISSIYFRFRYVIYGRFKKLNREIAEIESLEKE